MPLFSFSFYRHLLAYNGVVAITTDVLSTRTHRMNGSLTWPWPPRVAVATAFFNCLFVRLGTLFLVMNIGASVIAVISHR